MPCAKQLKARRAARKTGIEAEEEDPTTGALRVAAQSAVGP